MKVVFLMKVSTWIKLDFDENVFDETVFDEIGFDEIGF